MLDAEQTATHSEASRHYDDVPSREEWEECSENMSDVLRADR